MAGTEGGKGFGVHEYERVVLGGEGVEPRQPVQSGLNVCRADDRSSTSSGGFDGALSQVIDRARKSAGSLDEQFERLILKGVSMDADGPKPCRDVVTRLGRLEPTKGQSKAKP